jgi:ABC-type polysaccharide/polyol phosphate transport system ATPase subunit
MSSIVIQGEGLGKRYHRGVRQNNPSLRDYLGRFLRSPLSFFRRSTEETFWALKDISLEVHEGEVLGLIGRNGAGKTTLLRILTRITRPTTGWAEIRGRVRSLLEVGTGFHAELTGRENTYLSGSILGMGKREIDRKFDEIMAFAEIDKFIDTPVKHYSSGMYVRLAFAVAAHLEPEILLVDEVLAVGDLNFQKKCLGKMGDVARAGRTVVLVSHQMNQMRRLCNRVMWVDGGHIRMIGATHEVVSAYESAMTRGDRNGLSTNLTHGGSGRFLAWELDSGNDEDSHTLTRLGPVTVKFTMELKEPVRRGHHGIALYNHERQLIWGWATDGVALGAGVNQLCHTFPMLPIRPGSYGWLVSLYEEGEEVDSWECLPEMIVATPVYQHAYDHWNGPLNIPTEFVAVASDVTV